MISETDMGKQVVTSVKVDQETWKRAKIEAIKQGMTLADFLNKSIEDALKRSK